MEYLGHITTSTGIKFHKRKKAAVTWWPTPAPVRDIKSFFGPRNYNRKFVQEFSSIATTLIELTKEKNEFVLN